MIKDSFSPFKVEARVLCSGLLRWVGAPISLAGSGLWSGGVVATSWRSSWRGGRVTAGLDKGDDCMVSFSFPLYFRCWAWPNRCYRLVPVCIMGLPQWMYPWLALCQSRFWVSDSRILAPLVL